MLYEKILHSAYIYENIIKSMHDGVFTIDHSGTITTVNPSALDILEFKKEEILNKNFSEVFIKYPENDNFNQSVLDAVYKSFMCHHKICNYYTGKTTKCLFVTTSLLKTVEGGEASTLGVTVVFSDITELQEFRDEDLALKIRTSRFLR